MAQYYYYIINILIPMQPRKIFQSIILSPFIIRTTHKIRTLFFKDHDSFLKCATGVIHVGASTGGERKIYRAYNLPVVWIEPIPEVYEMLCKNIEGYPNNLAIRSLVTDKNDVEYLFNVSNNDGAASSILEFSHHKEIWPDVVYERQIKLKSITLSDLLKKQCINIALYNTLVIDAQGAELLVLKGAGDILNDIRFVKVEASDFELYKNCCQLNDVVEFLAQLSFREIARHQFAERLNGGACYNVIFKKYSLTK